MNEPRSRRSRFARAMVAAAVAGCAFHANAQPAATTPANAPMLTAADPTSRLQNRPDGALVRDVHAALRRARALDSSGIRVRARVGVVTLTGWVPAREQIARAGHAARSVRGVRSVSNQLVVRNTR
jgi:hyperosmotically inducible protein